MNPASLPVFFHICMLTAVARAADPGGPATNPPAPGQSVSPDQRIPDAPADAASKPGFGKCRINIDTSETPDLTGIANRQLLPVLQAWYPKLVAMLPSTGFEAPHEFSIVFKQDMPGVADTSGTHIRVAAAWFRANLKGEAFGAVIHEMVHVVQQYGRPVQPDAIPAPGWLTEGLDDYIRFYLFEPQTHGADISRNAAAGVQYNGSYRITANFINYVTLKYDNNLVPKLNAAIRNGNYHEDLWKKLTGHTVQELGAEWKSSLSQ